MAEPTPAPAASPVPQVGHVTWHELSMSLSAGWRDFRRAPAFGLFFSAVYVLTGLGLVALGAGTVTWTLMISLGFPLVAPFAAVGLYEVSRRLEDDEPLAWRAVLGVIAREKDRQIPWMGAIIVIYFLFWTFLAHMLFALIMGLGYISHFGTSFTLADFLTREALLMVAVELGVGAVFAFVLFAMTVVSLPLLLEKEIDFITAMLLSLAVVRANPVVMIGWAAIIAVLLLIAMLPYFLGLFIVLPVLGHATWHLYRRALYDPV